MTTNKNKPLHKDQPCIVVFSGGQDSTTCLHWAIFHFKQVVPIFFYYGQRHAIESESAQKIARLNNLTLETINLDFFKHFGSNALIHHNLHITTPQNDVPNTFVPGRNLIFLTVAASYAYTRDIHHIVTGVCQSDYSGYPDCRLDTMQALQNALSLGTDKSFIIHTPLMMLSKADTVRMAKQYGALDSLSFSHTCYEGVYPPCNKCPACKLRNKGFKEAGVPDPIYSRP